MGGMGLFRKTRKTHEQRYSAVYGEGRTIKSDDKANVQ